MERNVLLDLGISHEDNVRLTPDYRGSNGLTYALEMRYVFVEEFDIWVPCAQRIHVNRGHERRCHSPIARLCCGHESCVRLLDRFGRARDIPGRSDGRWRTL